MKAIIGIILCAFLWFFWRMSRKQKLRYKKLRKKILDRAKNTEEEPFGIREEEKHGEDVDPHDSSPADS